ncbi:MAG: single-stranded-DNA-specific exonuclease RecJ, partial [Dehalococcoidia bacterium]
SGDRRLLLDPFLLPGMDRAVERLSAALSTGQRIGLFGDFDVDGVTGTALLAQALTELGGQVVPYLPHRVTEGHGLNPAAITHLYQEGVRLLITVDCGVSSPDEVVQAGEMGMEVIITDHHVPPEQLPPVQALVNPKVPGSRYPFLDLSGAGLAFKLAQALYQRMERPWLRGILALAALGTVADLTPLQGENRFLVKQGLRELNSTQRPGLQELYRNAGIRPGGIDMETVSFIIAPRLNAAGRLEHALTSYRLLTTASTEEARGLAEQLGGLNQQRQQLTGEALERARQELLLRKELPPIILVGDASFSPGVVGLVASKLVEEFYRPAIVMAYEEGLVRASARSIPQFNMIEALTRCRDLFIRFGGHPQAAGFLLDRERLPLLEERLTLVAAERLASLDLQPTLPIDVETPLAQLDGETLRWLNALAPFGPGNPPPVFLSRGVNPVETHLMGHNGEHLRMRLKEGHVVWHATAFHQRGQGVPKASRLDIVYTLGTDRWGGQPVLALRVLDFRPAS